MNRGVLPDWYQYCCDERVSRTLSRAQASVLPDAGGRLLAWCRAGVRLGLGEGDGAGDKGHRSGDSDKIAGARKRERLIELWAHPA